MAARDDIELMQHVDGELPERHAAEIRGRIERDPEARTKVESLGQVDDLLRSHLELATDRVPDARFDAMWRAIDDATAAPAPAPGLGARLVRWLDAHRGHLLTGAVSAGAVATLALLLRPGALPPPPTPTAPVAVVHAVSDGAIAIRPVALRAAPEIDMLDTPDGEGTVLNLEDEDGHTTVIWVTPADTVEGI